MNLKDLLKKLSGRTSPSEGEGESVDSFELFEAESSFDSGLFLNSVEQLDEEDIELSPVAAQGKKKMKTSEIVRRVFLCVFAAVFLVSSILLIRSLISKYKAIEIYSQLEQEFFSSGFNFDITEFEIVDDGEVKLLSADREVAALRTWAQVLEAKESGTDLPDGERKEYNEELEKMRAGLTSLARINPDIYGWITVAGTNINYPLVQGTDNSYYLDHAYTGVYLPEGSIFVDYRNGSSVVDNYNTVFYGHNLTSGGMFHDVTKFAKEENMKNMLIYVYTFDGVFIYEPFSFYESRFDYNYFNTEFPNTDSFLSFANEVQNNSAVTKKDLTFTENDRLLTLSTCTNGYYTQRYALHAKLIRSITD